MQTNDNPPSVTISDRYDILREAERILLIANDTHLKAQEAVREANKALLQSVYDKRDKKKIQYGENIIESDGRIFCFELDGKNGAEQSILHFRLVNFKNID